MVQGLGFIFEPLWPSYTFIVQFSLVHLAVYHLNWFETPEKHSATDVTISWKQPVSLCSLPPVGGVLVERSLSTPSPAVAVWSNHSFDHQAVGFHQFQ